MKDQEIQGPTFALTSIFQEVDDRQYYSSNGLLFFLGE